MNLKTKYEVSKFLSLDGEISTSGDRIIENTYTGKRHRITQSMVEILEYFIEGTTIKSALDKIGIKKLSDKKLFMLICQELINEIILVPNKIGEIKTEASLWKQLKRDPLFLPKQSFIHCPIKSIKEVLPKEIVILGVPIDTASSGRPGTRFGPDAIRDISAQYIVYERDIFSGESLGWYNADIGRTILKGKSFVDIGNIVVRPDDCLEDIFKRISFCARELIKRDARLVTLGGDHSISAPLILSYLEKYQDLVIIHFDAHTDLAAWVPGKPNHHGNFMRRVMEGSIKVQAYQYGARGFSGEISYHERYHFYPQNHINSQLEDNYELMIPKNKRCYITLDIDVIDPCFAPGVGTPVPLGFDPKKLINLLNLIGRHNEIIGLDIVELCPEKDIDYQTASLAFHLLMNILASVWDNSFQIPTVII